MIRNVFFVLLQYFVIQNSVLSQDFFQHKFLNGRVTSSTTNEPIYYASVYIAGTYIGTHTDKLGRFRFDIPDTFLLKRELTLCVLSPGYLRDTYDIKTHQLPTELMISLLDQHVVVRNFDEYSINGYTIDKVTHLPISGVKINLLGCKKVKFSGDVGLFSFPLPQAVITKKLVLCFIKKGYRKQKIPFDIECLSDEFIIRL